MKVSNFYSWQSDLPGKTNRNFDSAIKKSLKALIKDNRIIACDDRDILKMSWKSDIHSASIFNKINHTTNSLFAMYHKTAAAQCSD